MLPGGLPEVRATVVVPSTKNADEILWLEFESLKKINSVAKESLQEYRTRSRFCSARPSQMNSFFVSFEHKCSRQKSKVDLRKHTKLSLSCVTSTSPPPSFLLVTVYTHVTVNWSMYRWKAWVTIVCRYRWTGDCIAGCTCICTIIRPSVRSRDDAYIGIWF